MLPSLVNGPRPGETSVRSKSVVQVGMEHRPDTAIWDYAKQNSYIIVTADDDFEKLSEQLGFPPKVILLANCNYPTRVAATLLRRNSIRIHEFERSNLGLLVYASDIELDVRFKRLASMPLLE